MPYTPPAGTVADLIFTGTYAVPVGNAVDLDFSLSPGLQQEATWVTTLDDVSLTVINAYHTVDWAATLDGVDFAVTVKTLHNATWSATLADVGFDLQAYPGVNSSLEATLDDCQFDAVTEWASGVWRGLSLFKEGLHSQIVINQRAYSQRSSSFLQAERKRLQLAESWDQAEPIAAKSQFEWLQIPHKPIDRAPGWTYVQAKAKSEQFAYASPPSKPLQRLPVWRTAMLYAIERSAGIKSPPRKKRDDVFNWALSAPRRFAIASSFGLANPVFKKDFWIVWEQGTPHNWEWNWHLPPGPTIPPYIPNPNLVFYQKHLDYPGGAILEFNYPCWAWPLINPNTHYHGGTLIMHHTVIVTTSPGMVNIPVQSVTLQFDNESWAWGVSLTFKKAESMALLERQNGEPQQVSIEIDGFYINAIIESWRQLTQFGETVYTATGRSPLALFAQPYAPIRSYLASEQQTAAQLIDHELLNTGWSASYHSSLSQLFTTDWLIPGGVWSYQNKSPIDAILQIANAAGARAYADRTAQLVHIDPRYPVNPWVWPDTTPDTTIYNSLARSISSQLAPQPDYNHIYVSGQTQGVLVSAIRTGTAGDKSMPMIIDSLITTVGAGRERARNVLAATGNQARVTVDLPMNSITGLLEPGKLVEIENVPSWFGLVTGVNINASQGIVNQQVEIERHYYEITP